MNGREPRPRRWIRIAFRLCVPLLALLVGEWTWRFVRTSGFGPTTNPQLVQDDPLLGWVYRPGAEARHRTDEFNVSIRIGPEGFRGGLGPDSVSPQVVALGDSFTFGWGVELEQTFPARLAAALGSRVWNLGISGQAPDQHLLMLRERLPGLLAGRASPEVILVNFCRNDLDEVLRSEVYGAAKPRYRLGAAGELVGPERPQVGWLTRNSQFFRSIRKWAVNWAVGRPAEVEPELARATVLALYRGLASAAADSGAALVLFHEGAPWLSDALEGVPNLYVHDLGPALAGNSGGPAVRFPSDGHWTARGHELVARSLLEFCRRRRLLP
ncbi:MAG: GDSL-type esterase/lipase family protein [Planctomycetota bacterium]